MKCAICEEEFEPRIGGKPQVLCGDKECRKKWRNAYMRKRYAEHPTHAIEQKEMMRKYREKQRAR